MEGLFKNKYKIKSTRLPGYDYSSSGFYFVTICTYNRICYFGDVVMDNNREYSVALTNIGKIARHCWLDIPKHFPDVRLDEWAIMPNHVHGIIILNKNGNQPVDHGICRNEAMPRLYTGPYPQMSNISPKPNSLPVIIGSFKSIVTKTVRRLHPDVNFHWQPRYYDRIIRDQRALNAVRRYIKINPTRWYRDRNNIENIWY